MDIVLNVNLEKALKELGLKYGEYLTLLDLLTDKEYDILEVIGFDTVSQVKLYIKEICKALNKRSVLPDKYLKYL